MSVEVNFTSLKEVRRKNKKLSKPKIIFYSILFVFLLINSIGLYIGNIYYNKAFKMQTGKGTNEFNTYKTTFNQNRYNNLEKEDLTLTSKYNYKIYGTYIKNSIPTKNVVVIVHGLGGSRWTSMKYTDMYLDKGFNVLVYDGRDHGESGGDNISYGFYEKDDLDKVITWAQSRNRGGILGVHGESMGAATALLHSEVNENKKKVKFYVADCSYSDLSELFSLRLKEDYNIKSPLIVKPLMFYADKIISFRSGFKIPQVSPIDSVKKASTPILFIHGEKDNYIPSSDSEEMYKAKSGVKDLYIAKDSGHAMSYLSNKEEYKNKLYKFIDSVATN